MTTIRGLSDQNLLAASIVFSLAIVLGLTAFPFVLFCIPIVAFALLLGQLGIVYAGVMRLGRGNGEGDRIIRVAIGVCVLSWVAVRVLMILGV